MSSSGFRSTTFCTTPGPLTPTLSEKSGSPTPWKAPGHEGVVFRGVDEHHEFGTAHAILRAARRFTEYPPQFYHGVQIHAGRVTADVQKRTHAPGAGKALREASP